MNTKRHGPVWTQNAMGRPEHKTPWADLPIQAVFSGPIPFNKIIIIIIQTLVYTKR